MRMVQVGAVLLALLGQGVGVALAEVYKCPRPDGSLTLSNVEKGSGCSKMVLPPSTAPKKVTSSTPRDTATKEPVKSAEKVKPSSTTYDTAATERKRVIQEEMDLEKSRLNVVQARIRDLSGNTTKTPDQVKELVGLQQKERLHASNIQLLQKELNR